MQQSLCQTLLLSWRLLVMIIHPPKCPSGTKQLSELEEMHWVAYYVAMEMIVKETAIGLGMKFPAFIHAYISKRESPSKLASFAISDIIKREVVY